MTIAAAPYLEDRAPLRGRFAGEALGRLILGGHDDSEQASDNATADRAAGKASETSRFALNPPDDSPAARIRYVSTLLNRRGEPIRALELAEKLLNGPNPLPPGLKLVLQNTVQDGVDTLKIMGRHVEANDWQRRLLPAQDSLDLNLEPSFRPGRAFSL